MARLAAGMVWGFLGCALLAALAGCVDTRFAVCATNQTTSQFTVEAWINGTGNDASSNHYSGLVAPKRVAGLGAFNRREGAYTVDVVAHNGTHRFVWHGQKSTLGQGTTDLHIDVQDDRVTAAQGTSNIEVAGGCGSPRTATPTTVETTATTQETNSTASPTTSA